ncbi:GUN4 domain-containing protein [Aphanizomenon sp. PH219]|nr:GUN4 domain-containing protein [Aphanizomenon sp. 202]MDK2461522.1 GUN4 domain-containing protein [Aphanizomenon sp. PH219]
MIKYLVVNKFFLKLLVLICKLFLVWTLVYFTIPLIILTPEIINNPVGNFILTLVFLCLPFFLIYLFVDEDMKKISHLLAILTNNQRYYQKNHQFIAYTTRYLILIIICFMPFLSFFSSYQIQNWIYWHPQHRQEDYIQLNQYLQAKNWEDAAKETQSVMLKITNRESNNWLSTRAIETFPCEALQNIDNLWLNASENRFGFSVQTKIWKQENNGQINFNYQIDQKFRQKVGWNPENITHIESHFQLSTDTPRGYLPKPVGTSLGKACVGNLDRLWFGQAVGCYHKIFIRMNDCK